MAYWCGMVIWVHLFLPQHTHERVTFCLNFWQNTKKPLLTFLWANRPTPHPHACWPYITLFEMDIISSSFVCPGVGGSGDSTIIESSPSLPLPSSQTRKKWDNWTLTDILEKLEPSRSSKEKIMVSFQKYRCYVFQEQTRIFRRQLEDKRPLVENNLMAGRQFLASAASGGINQDGSNGENGKDGKSRASVIACPFHSFKDPFRLRDSSIW